MESEDWMMSIAYNPRFFTRADFPDDRTFEAAVILRVLNTCEVDERNLSHKVWRKTCPFILQNDSIASKYMTPDHGFMYVEAAADHFDLPCKIEPAIDDRILQIPEIILEEIAAHDLHLAMKVWKWYLQEFLHKDPLEGDDYDLVIGPLNTLGNTMPDEFTDLLIAELETDDVLLNDLIYPNSETKTAVGCLASRAILIGNITAALRIIRTYLDKQPDRKCLHSMLFETVMGLCHYNNTDDMKRFETDVYPVIAAHPIWKNNPEFSQEAELLRSDIDDYYEDYAIVIQ